MQDSNTKPMGGLQWLALFAGVICAGISAANLVSDAIATGSFDLDDANMLGLWMITIATGLLAKANASARRWGYALAFYVVFVSGSVLVIYNSVGRQHGAEEGAIASVSGANKSLSDALAERNKIDNKIADIRAELARFAGVRSTSEIKGALDAAVGNGPGKVPVAVWRRTSGCAATEITKDESAPACKPVLDLRVENGKAIEREALRRRLDAAEDERARLVKDIGPQKAEKPLPVKARGFAEALAVLGFDKDRVETVMSRLDKVLLALVLEFGAIIGIEFGLAGLFVAGWTTAQVSKAEPEKIVDHEQPSGGDGGKVMSRPDALADLRLLLKAGHNPPSQDWLAERWGVSKSCVSKWLARWEDEDVLPAHRIAEGRCKSVVAA